MKTITVTVADGEQALIIMKTLETLPDVIDVTINESVTSGGNPRPAVDAVTRLSKASLGQA